MNNDNRITQLSLDTAEKFVERAMQQVRDGDAAWNPVYADVCEFGTGIKLGHLASDGYLHKSWSFYPAIDTRLKTRRAGNSYSELREQKERLEADPTLKLRREVKNKRFDAVVPKWCGRYNLHNIRTGVDDRADEEIALMLKKSEWSEVIGWLRNGNHTSGELADRIERELKDVS